MRRTPRAVADAGRRLADLHRRLVAIEAPAWMDPAPGPRGDRVVHLDLHPLNVMAASDGLVVIDWANARRGDPATDVANTWSLLACGEAPGGIVDRSFAAVGRRLMLRAFLGALDRAAAQSAMPALVEWRLGDRNHTPKERERLRALGSEPMLD